MLIWRRIFSKTTTTEKTYYYYELSMIIIVRRTRVNIHTYNRHKRNIILLLYTYKAINIYIYTIYYAISI